MSAPNLNITILALDGLMLILALGLFLLVLWLNPRRQINLYFGLFLFMVALWSVGTVLSHAMAIVGGQDELITFGVRLLQAGFVGSSIGVYLFTVVLAGSRGRFFTLISLAGLILIALYQILLFGTGLVTYTINASLRLLYTFHPFGVLLYVLFAGGAGGIAWFQRRRVRERGLILGVWLFLLAQLLALINPYLRSLTVPVLLADSGLFLISLSLVRSQVVAPLLGRTSQLETVRDIGLVITSRLQLDAVLSAIAAQATTLLNADAAAIYRLREDCLEVAAVYNMPYQFLGHKLTLGEGGAGQVASTGQALRLADYTVEWQGVPDLPLAGSTFGSVIIMPLVVSDRIQGILLVVQGRQGKIFEEEDVRLLQLLGPQAAVAIANSELFEQQSSLTLELGEAKNQLEAVLTSTQSPVIAVDRGLHIIFANPAAEALAVAIAGQPGVGDDLSPTQIVGRIQSGWRITDLVPDFVLPTSARQFLQALRHKGAYIYELDLVDRTYLCHIAALGAGRLIGWVAVLNDVTELKELDRFKSQMVRMTSHDLKNPLFAAMSYVELLQDEMEDNGVGTLGEEYIPTIFLQLERMNRTISSILDLERVEAGVHVRELCDFAALTTKTVAELETSIQAGKLNFEVAVAGEIPPVLGDPRQLGQVMANLIENAIKFTPHDGNIRIDVRTTEDDGVLLSVADTGVGIPPEMLNRVFERFFRGKQPGVEHVGGSGLGLSLVRAIVQVHEGRVWLESDVGQGTTVFVWLPQYHEEHAEL